MYVIANYKQQDVVMPEAEAKARGLKCDSWRFLSFEDALNRYPYALTKVTQQLEAENAALKTRLLTVESQLRIEKTQHDNVMEKLREANLEIARLRKAEEERIAAINRVKAGDRWTRRPRPAAAEAPAGEDKDAKVLVIPAGGRESFEKVQMRAAGETRKEELKAKSDAAVAAKLEAWRAARKKERETGEKEDFSHIAFLTGGGITPEGA